MSDIPLAPIEREHIDNLRSLADRIERREVFLQDAELEKKDDQQSRITSYWVRVQEFHRRDDR
jgi:hypothetical protein